LPEEERRFLANVILNEGRKPAAKDLAFAFGFDVAFRFPLLSNGRSSEVKAKTTPKAKANARSFASGFPVGSG
jgi:hypothetical protein